MAPAQGRRQRKVSANVERQNRLRGASARKTPVRNLQVGAGPVQNSMQYKRVKGFLTDIETSSQTVAFGGSPPAAAGKGYFIHPHIIDNPSDDSCIVVEEPFGTILPIMSWEDEDEKEMLNNEEQKGSQLRFISFAARMQHVVADAVGCKVIGRGQR